jgi:hypothetical protein
MPFEHARALTMKKPFDVLAEGLISKNSRGDWTPLELFIAGVRAWDVEMRRRLAPGIKCLPAVTTQAQRPGPRDARIATVPRWPGSLQRMVIRQARLSRAARQACTRPGGPPLRQRPLKEAPLKQDQLSKR